ncbi:hypothetical protein [Paenibacillus sonchi]|uniref:hypothetical protein n=1 Tax=Paenibacillus sonchi TaxID=373687 RepID=UPI001E28F3B7|nr:hypothetical protein [Paenibacillus sonchi]MCE3204081.1 hypothetical protein [Paenibacillus sonchi]
MKKRLFVVLATVAALSLAMPMSGFAKSNPADVTSSSTQSKAFKVEKAKTIQGFGDVSAQELIHSENSFVENDGENDYYESYRTSMGNTIRYYLLDEGNKGLTIKIYYADEDYNTTSLYASGSTSSSNNWTVLTEIPAPSKDTNFVVRIVSKDGSGGYEYGFQSAIRAF